MERRDVGVDLCRAIAKALGIPQQEVFIRAGLMDPPPNYDPDTARLLHKFAELKPEYRPEIEDLIDIKLKRQKHPEPGTAKTRTGKMPVLSG